MRFQIDADTGTEITFGEINELSIRCALWLNSQNIGKNDIVAVSYFNHLHSYIPILATFYEGAIYSAWHYEMTLGNIIINIIINIIL